MSGSRGSEPGRRASEARLDALREEARRTGTVSEAGVRAAGGPLPSTTGYYGRPVVKPPVWTWEIPLYFFVGGLAGMAGVLALAATLTSPGEVLDGAGGHGGFVRAALWIAAVGTLVSAILLTMDLGRPARFLNMLRMFKPRSPMSVGAWILTGFGGASTAGALLVELIHRDVLPGGETLGLPVAALEAVVLLAILGTGIFGAALATYTGVLIGATAIPAWFIHHRGLPLHFGVAGLGAAAALLELLGFRLGALNAIGVLASAVETTFGAWVELRRRGAADRALRQGGPGVLLRTSGLLAGPGSLVLRLLGWIPWAASAFLAGALISRYGWLAAGRASGRDPEATFASQRAS